MVVIYYGMGNIGSVLNMLKRVVGDAVSSSETLRMIAASKLILPGVGAFDNGMENLRSRGLIGVLTEQVRERQKPILGLCLGMQLFGHGSEEGVQPGLGWLDAHCRRFRFEAGGWKCPHMGWNQIKPTSVIPLLASLGDETRFYFSHSYHVCCQDAGEVVATTTHGYEFASVVCSHNIVGVQFHPEKSHKYGMRLMADFAASG